MKWKWFNEEDINMVVRNELAKYINSLYDIKFSVIEDIIRCSNIFKIVSEGLNDPRDVVRCMVKQHVLKSKETIFGAVPENIMLWLAARRYDAIKSSRPCVDFEYTLTRVFHVVSVKSSPNWGNSDQINRMLSEFRHIVASKSTTHDDVVCINLCAYGTDNSPEKIFNDGFKYYKLCGVKAWQFLTDDERFLYYLLNVAMSVADSMNVLSKYNEIDTAIKDRVETYILKKGLQSMDDLLDIYLADKRTDKNIFKNLQTDLFINNCEALLNAKTNSN